MPWPPTSKPNYVRRTRISSPRLPRGGSGWLAHGPSCWERQIDDPEVAGWSHHLPSASSHRESVHGRPRQHAPRQRQVDEACRLSDLTTPLKRPSVGHHAQQTRARFPTFRSGNPNQDQATRTETAAVAESSAPRAQPGDRNERRTAALAVTSFSSYPWPSALLPRRHPRRG
jgi:hypothetical protein